MVDSSPVEAVIGQKINAGLVIPQSDNKPHSELFVASILKPIQEEKVEVLIKEVIRIKPQDFSAFKHALEDFVNSWES